MKQALTAYFSASGVTAQAARALAEAAGTELYEIRPQTPYAAADLDWTNPRSRSSREAQDRTLRPPLADRDAPVRNCDVIFLGFPIWWYTAPAIVRTFLESYDFSGKTIVLFATSGGSGLGNTAEDLRASVGSGAVIREGTVLNGPQTRESLAAWIAGLAL